MKHHKKHAHLKPSTVEKVSIKNDEETEMEKYERETMEVVNEEMQNILGEDSESEGKENSLSDKKIVEDVRALEQLPAVNAKPVTKVEGLKSSIHPPVV